MISIPPRTGQDESAIRQACLALLCGAPGSVAHWVTCASKWQGNGAKDDRVPVGRVPWVLEVWQLGPVGAADLVWRKGLG